MSTRVLVIGAGGREHALVRQLAIATPEPVLFAAPGNPGTEGLATNLPLEVADHEQVIAACRRERIELVVIGPEDPLIVGLADDLRDAGLAVFGPGREGARLEGDKQYAKEVMAAAQVPTARYAAFTELAAALAYLEEVSLPVVVKACGAAQGKGVAVCTDRQEAAAHLTLCLQERKFGAAGARVLIEECLTGPELSVLAVTDGESHALLAPSRDHKRIGEGDTGPNTGGMGAFAPVSLTPELARCVDEEIIVPVLSELRRRGIDYRGVLYAGLMITPSGPRVLEFNFRFGDPETQVVLPLLAGDFLALVRAAASRELDAFLAASRATVTSQAPEHWRGAALTDWSRHCVVVVGVARGYPGSYPKELPLELPADRGEAAWIIHAGTARRKQKLVTAGGRVLGAVGTGASLAAARQAAYELLGEVVCDGLVHRRDIGGAARTAGGTD